MPSEPVHPPASLAQPTARAHLLTRPVAARQVVRNPLTALPASLNSLIQAMVALGRLSKFLLHEELSADPEDVRTREHPGRDSGLPAIEIKDGTFAWGAPPSKDGEGPPAKEAPATAETVRAAGVGDGSDQPEDTAKPILRDINFAVAPGELVAIVGAVGSGKSSVLSAILNEMLKTAGTVATRGSIAYVPQKGSLDRPFRRRPLLTPARTLPFALSLSRSLAAASLHRVRHSPQ